jgi:beta-alanine degradation protein BauB
MGDVGSYKVFENDKIMIWELVLEPGQQTACHTHRHDYVFYVLEGSTLEVFDENEDFLFAFASNMGDAFAFKCREGQLVSSDDKGLHVTATHSARNTGRIRYREILVETK